MLIDEGTNLCYSLRTCFWFAHGLVQLLFDTGNSYHHYIKDLLFFFQFFFVFHSFREIYVWFITVEAYLIPYITHSWNTIENKVAAFPPNRLPQTYLILIQKLIKMLMDSFVCVITNHSYAACRINRTISITFCWWHKFRFHYQMRFPFTRFLKIIYEIA